MTTPVQKRLLLPDYETKLCILIICIDYIVANISKTEPMCDSVVPVFNINYY